MSAIRPSQFRRNEAKVLAPGLAFPDRAKVRLGDVLTNRASGSLQLVGSVCLVEDDPGQLLLSDKTLRLRFNHEKVHPRYAVQALATRSFREQVEQEASGSSGQKNISQGDIARFEIPLPRVEVQIAIADRLFALRDTARDTAAEADALVAVRASLLDSLLSRETRMRSAAAIAEVAVV